VTHLRRQLELFSFGPFVAGLADRFTVIRYDKPGCGLFYQLPFERFERYCPYGTADDVAEFLAPYVAAGCTEFNLIPQSPAPDRAVAGVAAVRNLLARTRVPSAGPHPVLPPGGSPH
jgi:hypothetical protein